MPTAKLCSLPPQSDFGGVRHTGRGATYTKADTWYPSWDRDGNLYSPYADGIVDPEPLVLCTWGQAMETFARSLSCGGKTTASKKSVTTGNAIIRGEDPLALEVQPLAPCTLATPRFQGLYPCANLCHDGIWYQGSYYLHRFVDDAGRNITYELGPFQGFRLSRDHGATWEPCPRDDSDPLFREHGRVAGGPPIRFGAPHVVDFGRNMAHSPTGHLYLVGHGSRFAHGVSNWIAGDAVFLARVMPSPGTVNDPDAYEFFSGRSHTGDPIWGNDAALAQPIIEWPWHCGCTTVTWLPALGRYIACISVGPADGGGGCYDLWMATSPDLCGPWSQLAYLESFGTQGYFANIPSKFLSEDNRTFWMFWSANWEQGAWSNPPCSAYALCAGEFELMGPEGVNLRQGPSWRRSREEWNVSAAGTPSAAGEA